MLSLGLVSPLGFLVSNPSFRCGCCHAGWLGPQTGEGRAWRACLAQLAQQASGAEVLLAVARRSELHTAVGTEPPSDAENRRVVRALARMLGLVDSGTDEGG